MYLGRHPYSLNPLCQVPNDFEDCPPGSSRYTQRPCYSLIKSVIFVAMLVPLVALVAASVVVRAFVSQDAYRNLTVVRSPGDAGVTVSFKEPKGVCKTAVDTQRQFTGWVNVPGEFPTNLFFWFVEARKPTESLTLWLNGGPGASSLIGFFTGVGPCEVIERGLDEYETVAREWSWDRASNMLFIDQVLLPPCLFDELDAPSNRSVPG